MKQAGCIRTLRDKGLTVEVYENTEAMGRAAAAAAAQRLRELAASSDVFGVILATGASQMATLEALTSTPGLPWEKVVGFHMDEYLGISDQHRASFRRYMRERLVDKVKMRQFYFLDGSAADADETCRKYAECLQQYRPQLCLLGIGENGHIAFNDPMEADFHDPLEVKVVSLDQECRQQQVSEGWFASIPEVPERALTLTIPVLLRVPQLIASVPSQRKANIVRRTLTEEISTRCPATILRTHPNTTIYLDPASAAELPPEDDSAR